MGLTPDKIALLIYQYLEQEGFTETKYCGPEDIVLTHEEISYFALSKGKRAAHFLIGEIEGAHFRGYKAGKGIPKCDLFVFDFGDFRAVIKR